MTRIQLAIVLWLLPLMACGRAGAANPPPEAPPPLMEAELAEGARLVNPARRGAGQADERALAAFIGLRAGRRGSLRRSPRRQPAATAHQHADAAGAAAQSAGR